MKPERLKLPNYKKLPKKEIVVEDHSINTPLIVNGLKGNDFLPINIESIIQNEYLNTNNTDVSCKCYHHAPTNCNLYYISNEYTGDQRKKAEQLLTLMVKMKCIWRGNDPSNPINLVFWNIDEPKVFPSKGKVLGVEDVNSAVTYLYRGIKYGDIYIYRAEEAPKVVVHEMIHALGIDRPLFDSKMPICVTSDMNTNEAFTEALALYFCYMLSSNHNDSLKYIEKEYQYGLNQSAKILNHNELTLKELNSSFEKPTTSKNKIKKCFPQTSGVFSYYIAKTSLLPRMDSVFKCITGGKNQYVISANKAEKLLADTLRNKQFVNDLENKQRLISNRNTEGKSLRMSLFKK